MKKLLSLVVFLQIGILAFGQIVYYGEEATQIIPEAQVVRMKDFTSFPNFIKFRNDHIMPLDKVEGYVLGLLKENKSQFGLKLIRVESDDLGYKHYRYVQTYKGHEIALTALIVHAKNGAVVSMNGNMLDGKQLAINDFTLGESAALQKALDQIGADIYKWELPQEEEHLKWEQEDPNATYYPQAELVYVHTGADIQSGEMVAAYKFDIYAHEPVSRAEYFVNASTGEIVYDNDIIHHANATGTAYTKYSGTQTFTTDKVSASSYRLRETGRGNGIRTFNLQKSSNYGSAVDFTDANNIWNNVNANQDEVATDAHWGAEMTYDYYWNVHNRNSIDGNGFRLDSYVHYNNNYNNAFWDGQRMTYGDGDGSTFTPLTALDVTGHEISHGLTSNTAALVYQNESGALNESFSDIFGACVEYYGDTTKQTWRVGEDMTPSGNGIRSMKNPKLFNDPDTYQGTQWYTGTADNGGVHTNSGVQNHWFYILSEGESGTNDNSDSYNVTGIGIVKAAKIAFRNLTVYLSSNSQYSDARFYAIQSAQDLYGPCTPEVIATTNAWYAVGVGTQFQTGVTAAFSATSTSGCSLPFKVTFSNSSSNAGNFHWDFGDGSSDTLQTPTHSYNSFGTYAVKLVADGGACGKDSVQKTAYITIQGPASPSGVNDTIPPNTQATLTASGSSFLNWYDAQIGGNYLGTGSVYTTPNLLVTTRYWVEDSVPKSPQKVGPANNSIGSGAYFQYNQYLIFDVYKQATLKSVKVYAGSTKNRTIELRDQNGVVLQSKTVNIAAGQSRVTLNFSLTPGTNYQLGVSNSAAPDLYRNNSGPTYPYTLTGLVSITGSSASQPGYYYFFYDWEVQEDACESARTPVDAIVQVATSIADNALSGSELEIYPNPAQQNVYVRVPFSQQASLKLVSTEGKVVKEMMISGKSNSNVQIDLADVNAGVYFVKVITKDSQQFVNKLVVVK